jgi:hypothetical protein
MRRTTDGVRRTASGMRRHASAPEQLCFAV